MSKSSTAPTDAAGLEESRREFYERLKPMRLEPLWAVIRSTLTAEPVRRETPHLWRWKDVRPQILRAGELVTAKEAERRVLYFSNPGNPSGLGATATIYAAVQLFLPGETARAHRHSPSAIRFIIEGAGAFTCVNGEKVFMEEGDLILTPTDVWHDHGNDTDHPVMWLDGLDIPFMDSIHCMFFEQLGQETQMGDRPERGTEKTYGRGLQPASRSIAEVPQAFSPVWAYRYSDAREALDILRRSENPDPYDGHLLRYINPVNGGEVLPTLGCRLQLIEQGVHTQAHRHSMSAVYHVVEGAGYSVLDGARFDWAKGDTFAVPIWTWHEHAATGDAVLFSLTDEPILKAIGQIREQKHEANGGQQKVIA